MLLNEISVNGVKVGQLKIINDAMGNKSFGNYEFVLEDDRERSAGVGYIEGFGRKQSPWRLIYECLKQVYDDRDGIWKDK